ncbi:MAG: hypothetical protein IJY04_04545, partial [Clostridia bacterium]|nr:hypothetical protein [Clostridia bacterium]
MNISEGAVDRKNVLGGVLRSVRYTIAIAWRELMLGRYKLIICALCAFLGLYATDGLQRKIEGLDVSYYVLFLLGLGMGIAALDYLFHDRYSMLYRALPLGKRWMLILRMSVSLLSCAAVILAVYLLFFYAKGLDDPEFHLTDFYKLRVGLSDVLDPLIGLFGARLWLTVGWELFKSGMIVFSCGFFLGTFSAVISPSKIFAPICALGMWGVEVLIGFA